ncbi:hypothetical protein NSU18_03190 [Paenibacillus sp. FSL H8-0048]|uniref:hypothetical protein n=1 Tax=Paenibacillus sp. FSL H8-0048 TaxID=2954508 RepID=UPI0030FBB4A1
MIKRKLLVPAAAISIILALAGCTGRDDEDQALQGNNSVHPVSSPIDDSSTQTITNYEFESVKTITFTKLLNKTPESSEVSMEYTDQESIEVIVRAIQSAVPIPGILNVSDAGYDILMESAKKKYAFQLWINEKSEQAMIMDMRDTHTGYTLTKEATAELKKKVFAASSLEDLTFRAVRNSAGDLVARPIGLPKNNYSLSGGPAVELQGIKYHTVHLFYGDHNAINALISHDPSTDEVRVRWSDTLNSSDNRWNNSFMSSYNMLFPMDNDRLLFLESELTEKAGQYHLSAYNTATGAIERLREDFWPLTPDYDYIYNQEWRADEQKLFLQSYLGNVWIFDLKTGKDDVHLLKYPVIPHSTSGAPSLFLAPTLERFVHDDESGQLTFYNNKGVPLRRVALPTNQYVPSEKIKWNPAGTIAWMNQSLNESKRILDIDIDYLEIAPQAIHFYDKDGLPIASIQTEDSNDDSAVEVAGWRDANFAVIKSYTLEPSPTGYSAPKAKDISYFLYDVKNKKKGSSSNSIPPDTTVISDREAVGTGNNGNIIVSNTEITYKDRD